MEKRRSALAGKSAVAPASPSNQTPPEEAQNSAPEPEQNDSAPPAPAAYKSAAERPTEPSKAKKKKVSFYQLPEEEQRARAAWMHTMGHTGYTTITSFHEAAVSYFTRHLEAEYNDSKPFN